MNYKIYFELTTNESYINSHISLEEILRNGWVRGNNVDNVLHEAAKMGYNIDKQYIINTWKAWDAELEYYDFGLEKRG